MQQNEILGECHTMSGNMNPALKLRTVFESCPQTFTVLGLGEEDHEEFLRWENELSGTPKGESDKRPRSVV